MEPGRAIIRLVADLDSSRTREQPGKDTTEEWRHAGKDLNSSYDAIKDTSDGGVLNTEVVHVIETHNYAFGVIAIRVKVQPTGP